MRAKAERGSPGCRCRSAAPCRGRKALPRRSGRPARPSDSRSRARRARCATATARPARRGVMRAGRGGNRRQPRHVGRETRHRDAVVLLPTRSISVFCTVASEPASPDSSRWWNRRSSPARLRAEALQRFHVRRLADQRIGIEFPVAGMQHRTNGVRITTALGSGSNGSA